MDVKIAAFMVRRARLISGLTQGAFDAKMGAEFGSTERWERAIAPPTPKQCAKIKDIILGRCEKCELKNEDIKRSPIYKAVLGGNDLYPIMISNGMRHGLIRIGAWQEHDLFPENLDALRLYTEASELYEESVLKALRTILPYWEDGDVVYARIHALSPVLGNQWMDGILAPIPCRSEAIIEGMISPLGRDKGLNVTIALLRNQMDRFAIQ